MMRRWVLASVLALLVCFASCRKDVDLYADYKTIPVVYGLLDANLDTNYIKITKSFYALGDNAPQIAMNPDSSNYQGKLDVRLTEYCNGDSVRQIIFDTITIGNKQPGIFYAPKQKLYYTAERLNKNSRGKRYEYELSIVLPDKVLVSKTAIVGSDGFKVKSLAANFSQEYFGVNRPLEFYPALNATSYEVTMSFTFKEQRYPGGDSIPRTMHWHIGDYNNAFLFYHLIDDSYYRISYRPERFYAELREFLGGDTSVAGLTRMIGDYPIVFTIAAAGDELTRYMEWNALGFYGSVSGGDYSLIDGGTGVFSSRMTTSSKVRLAGTTVPELVAHRTWGFKFTGGD